MEEQNITETNDDEVAVEDKVFPGKLPQNEKGKSGCAKWGIGCGVGCLVIFLLIAAGGAYFYSKFMDRLDEEIKHYTDQGYKRAETDLWSITEVNDPITEKSLYVGNIVNLNNGASVDIAMMGNMCKLTGEFKKVSFKGNMLILAPGSKIEELDGFVNLLVNQGVVENQKAKVNQVTNKMPSSAEMEKIKLDLKDFDKFKDEKPVETSPANEKTDASFSDNTGKQD